MKNILIADNRPDLIATLGPILKHWGYRILATSSAEEVDSFLQDSAPCLLIIGEELLADSALAISAKAQKKLEKGDIPLVALGQKGAGKALLDPCATLTAPVDLFELFSFIQQQVEKHPRRNLRLRLSLPGMYSTEEEDTFILADVLSLSSEGLFFKASTKVQKGQRVKVVFPLFGHCKEIEVDATVVYTVQPDTSNNFSQGFGVNFDEIPVELKGQLQLYIKEHFLKEVSSSNDGVSAFDDGQFKE